MNETRGDDLTNGQWREEGEISGSYDTWASIIKGWAFKKPISKPKSTLSLCRTLMTQLGMEDLNQ